MQLVTHRCRWSQTESKNPRPDIQRYRLARLAIGGLSFFLLHVCLLHESCHSRAACNGRTGFSLTSCYVRGEWTAFWRLNCDLKRHAAQAGFRCALDAIFVLRRDRLLLQPY